jgi:hypothetical protein
VPGDRVVGVNVDEDLPRSIDVDGVMEALPERPEVQPAAARFRMREIVPERRGPIRRNELETEGRVRSPELWIRDPAVMDQRPVLNHGVEVVGAFLPARTEDSEVLVAGAIRVRPRIEVVQVVPRVAPAMRGMGALPDLVRGAAVDEEFAARVEPASCRV